ncbi:MAG: hypothetical protein J0I54_17730 [Bosea sp.]|uniref:hypothetical protein n=1 Tax=unclassified Bosea (in: a-proteobacteria) TaxID=2653178 RepID=UPI000961A000|nr:MULTISPECIES: hypothetical protein [unclassified Bosea (in: a-proteobacteria)]MBN9458474.1 hypothetical protein [Bosea sp. (in: a-proteobacteria)]OJV06824.1 MAG: hypothetical protein BGO20_00215 [Bosea sp. 67-29]
MGWFSGLFSSKQRRLDQIWQAQQLQQQQEQAAAEQQRLNDELKASRADASKQIELLNQQSEAALSQAAETARLSQKQAEEASYRASLTPADSEDARAAADRKLKKLQAARGIASTIVQRAGGLGAPSVATQQLLGA